MRGKKRRILIRNKRSKLVDINGVKIYDANAEFEITSDSDYDWEYIELGGKIDMITSGMLDIHTNAYGYQDRYIGRMPRLLHEIPEAGIWECNPEYTGLIFEKVAGTLNEENISQELDHQLTHDIQLIQRLDLISTYDEKKIATCAGYGPTGNMECDESYQCDEILICDYLPYNIYPEYQPNYVADFVPSKDLIHEVKFDWTLSSHGTQPIYYDIYRWNKLTGIVSLIAIDTEPGIVIYEPYGAYMYKLKIYNSEGVAYTDWYEGISNTPTNTGSTCCSQARARCQVFNTVGLSDPFDNFIPREHDGLLTSYIHGSCLEVFYDDGNTTCDGMMPCETEEVCPNCLDFYVYGTACDTEQYEFLRFYTVNGKEFKTSDMHGSCKEPTYEDMLGLQCGPDMDKTDFHVWSQMDGMHIPFLVDSEEFIASVGCPDCIDYNIWDDKINDWDNFITKGHHFVASSVHGKCGTEIIYRAPIFGIDCTCSPCEDCVDLNVFNDDSGFDRFVDKNGYEVKISLKHGVCGFEEIDDGTGLTCEEGSCPHCITFKSNDKVNNEFVDFIANTGPMIVSSRHGSCAIASIEIPDSGLSCTPDVDCPNCIEFNSYNGTDIPDRFNTFDAEPFFVGSKHGLCAQLPGEAYAVGTGMDCDGGACPDCIDFKAWNGELVIAGVSTFYSLWEKDGNFMSSSDTHGTCAVSVIPSEPTNVVASTTNVEYIEITWTDSVSGDPAPTYNIYRDNFLIASQATSPWIEIIESGTYEYYIRAVNYVGSVNSIIVDGTSVNGTVPSLYENFIVDDESFITDIEPFMVSK